jgi:hypothetical protein
MPSMEGPGGRKDEYAVGFDPDHNAKKREEEMRQQNVEELTKAEIQGNNSQIRVNTQKLQDAAAMREKIAAAGETLPEETREAFLAEIEVFEGNLRTELVELQQNQQALQEKADLIAGRPPEYIQKWWDKLGKIQDSYQTAKERINVASMWFAGTGAGVGVSAYTFLSNNEMPHYIDPLESLSSYTSSVLEASIVGGGTMFATGAAVYVLGHAINKSIEKVRTYIHAANGTAEIARN